MNNIPIRFNHQKGQLYGQKILCIILKRTSTFDWCPYYFSLQVYVYDSFRTVIFKTITLHIVQLESKLINFKILPIRW